MPHRHQNWSHNLKNPKNELELQQDEVKNLKSAEAASEGPNVTFNAVKYAAYH